MDKEIIRLLKSSNPQDRIEGITRLAHSGHADTIKILGAVYKKETDARVKKHAATIAKQVKEGTLPPALEPDFEDDFDFDFSSPAQSATRRDPAAAKEHLERAMDAVIEFKNDEAWDWAKKAFLADPDLAEDEYAVGVAAEITGVDRGIAVDTLLSGGNIIVPEKAKRSSKNKLSDNPEQVSWAKALTGIAIYAVLLALFVSVPFFLVGGAMSTILSAYGSGADIPPGSFAAMGIGMGIGAFFGSFIMVLIQYGAVHFSAMSILGGDGHFTNLLYNVRIPLISQLIVQAVFIIVVFVLAFQSVSSADPDAANQTLGVIQGVNGLIGLGFIVWLSIVIGNTYNFGGVKGCLSMIISYVLLGVLACGCYFVFFSLFFNSLSSQFA